MPTPKDTSSPNSGKSDSDFSEAEFKKFIDDQSREYIRLHYGVKLMLYRIHEALISSGGAQEKIIAGNDVDEVVDLVLRLSRVEEKTDTLKSVRILLAAALRFSVAIARGVDRLSPASTESPDDPISI